MPNIKPAAPASQQAVDMEREFQLARQQAELKSSELLIQKSTQLSHKEDETESSKDTAEISETRRWFHTDGTISPNETLKWLLEMAGQDWESFLEWHPDPDMNLPLQLDELSKLYLSLLEAALKYAQGDNLTEQLNRLDLLLAQKLTLLMDQNLEQLTSFLEETGENAALDTIRSSLYRQTAGRTISLQAAHTLFAQKGAAAGKNTESYAASSSSSKNGMIYQSSGKQNIRFQQTYNIQQNSWKEQLRQRNEVISNTAKGIAQNTFRQGNSVPCSGRELQAANRFATHINGRGNLFKNPGITAGNEEVTGLLAAVMSIKGQVYAAENGRNSSLTFSLQNAIEKIINQYLKRQGASKIYYHTLTAYKQTQNPRKAIAEGQNYASKQFKEKQEDPAYQNSPQYSKESGFFHALLKNLSPEKDFALGINILQKDWQNFMTAMGDRPGLPYLSERGLHSPWGILAGIGGHGPTAGKHIGKILLAAAVTVLTALLVMVCFYFL